MYIGRWFTLFRILELDTDSDNDYRVSDLESFVTDDEADRSSGDTRDYDEERGNQSRGWITQPSCDANSRDIDPQLAHQWGGYWFLKSCTTQFFEAVTGKCHWMPCIC